MGLVQHYPALNRPPAPICSVCIANYNGAAFLAECLESVLAQSAALEIEIIVHDDASTDGSVSLLQEHYPQVELLVSSGNVGFCVSNNRMVAHARGEYVLLLNNDAALQPDAVETLLTRSNTQKIKGIVTLPQYDWETGEVVDRGCLLDALYNPVPNLNANRAEVAMVIGACMFMPRELWHRLGGFPSWLESIGEDMYLCCQARLQNFTVEVTRASGYRHMQGKSFGGNRVDAGRLSTTYRRRRMSERNKTAVLFICTPTAIVWPLLCAHLMLLAFEGLTLSLIQRNSRTWKDIYAPVFSFIETHKETLLALRKEAQKKRLTSLQSYKKNFVLFPQKLRLLIRHGLPTIR